MKKNNKQEEFTKKLDLGKEDISNLSQEAMYNINGGQWITKPTNEAGCSETDTCPTVGCTYTCVCANTRICMS